MALTEKSNVDMVEDNLAGSNEKANPSNVAENLATVDMSGPPNPWGKGRKRLYFYCALIYLCSTMNGRSSRTMSLAHRLMLDRI